MQKKAPDIAQVNHAVWQNLPPEHVEVEICRAEELDQRRGLTSELDERWSYVGKKAEPRWLWHAMAHHSGPVLAYVFGRRKDAVFLQWQTLLDRIPTVSPLMIPLVYCHINSFQRASSVEKPLPGRENRIDGRASHHVEW